MADEEDITRWGEDDDPESLVGGEDLGIQAWEGVLTIPEGLVFPEVAN